MIHINDIVAPERDKYEEIWAVSSYSDVSPGLEGVDQFMQVIKPKLGLWLLDVGCGSGCAGLEFKKRGLDVWWLDIIDTALLPAVPRNRFIQSPLWKFNGAGPGWDYGYCVDVMEHIPTEWTMVAAERIIQSCTTTWFSICLHADQFGLLIGKSLHETVRSYEWWRDRLATLGDLVDARDLLTHGLYVVER